MRTRLAATAILVLLLGACTAARDTTALPTPPTPATPQATAVPPASSPASPNGPSRPETTADGGAPPGTTATEEPPTTPAPSLDDHGQVGHLALAYLRSDQPKLVVEITAVEGRSPSREARNLLATRLRSVLDKPGGIEMLDPRVIPPQGNRHTLDDIRAVEDAHRTHFSTDGTVIMHYLFLDGEFAEEEGALGLAYRASSVAIFPDTIDAASTPLVTSEAIEGSVVVHEAGHLLRLVNIGYRSPRDHEDPEHPNHTKHRDGVMFWAVESISVANVLAGGPPDDFHPDSRADLRDLQSGRIRPDG